MISNNIYFLIIKLMTLEAHLMIHFNYVLMNKKHRSLNEGEGHARRNTINVSLELTPFLLAII